jgi:predicted DCC family thiol-disulfide oxidoreductase YuxK
MSSTITASQDELRLLVAGRPLMLFDGQCGFCHSAVRWVIRRDHQDRFRFAPQESPLAAALLDRHGIDRDAMLKSNSVYMVLDSGTVQERLLTQSDVTVNILMSLGGRWRLLGHILRAVPRFLRNAAYRMLARNRYRLAGRYDVCPLPAESDRRKFIS